MLCMDKVMKNGVSDRHPEYMSESRRVECIPAQKESYTIKG